MKHCVHVVFISCSSNGFYLLSKGFNPSGRRNQCPNTPLLVCLGRRDVSHCSISLLNLFEIHEFSCFLNKFLNKLNKNLPIYLHSKFPFQSACLISRILFSVASSFFVLRSCLLPKTCKLSFFLQETRFCMS